MKKFILLVCSAWLFLLAGCNASSTTYVEQFLTSFTLTQEQTEVLVAAETNVELGEGEYLYTASEGAHILTTTYIGGETFITLLPVEREIWLGRDGSGKLIQTYGEPYFFTEEEEAAWQEAGSPELKPPAMEESWPPDEEIAQLFDLPTEESAVADLIREQAELTDNPIAYQMFDYVGSHLREQPTSQEQRQALYAVALDIEGVQETLDGVDRLDRPAHILSHTSEFNETLTETRYFFDPETYRLLAEEEILLAPSPWYTAEPGTTIGWSTSTEIVEVTSVEETSALD